MMKKIIPYLIMALMVVITSLTIQAQQDWHLQRSAIGSGSSLYLQESSTGGHLSGMVGQPAIEFVQNSGNPNILYQGFWVPIIDTIIGVEDDPIVAATELGNYPNPFGNSTSIRYNLPGESNVSLKIFDLAGRMQKMLFNGVQSKGQQNLIYDGKGISNIDLVAGSYIYELHVRPVGSAGFREYTIRKMMIIIR